ncbi:MAG: hypothetical protein LLG04_18600 [Parachlamydia sp.]|nr:hypothetical protein [Parachlamydia sp.]
MRDTALCAALNEIHKNMLSYLSGKGLGDKGLNLILERCPSLQSLNISGFASITAAALPRIATLSNLTNLDLCGTTVRDLTPLCKTPFLSTPLPNLISVNFCQTPIPPDSLISFLRCHSIQVLIPPKNPPKGFFDRFPSDQLTEVTLHIDQSDEYTMDLQEVLTFLNKGASLKKLILVIEVANAHFHTNMVSEAPTTRELVILNRGNEFRMKIKGKINFL